MVGVMLDNGSVMFGITLALFAVDVGLTEFYFPWTVTAMLFNQRVMCQQQIANVCCNG